MSCEACAAMAEKVETLEWRVRKLVEDHELAEQQIAHDRRRIANLQGRLDEKNKAEADNPTVRDVFDYWVTACRKDPTRTKLTPQRTVAIKKALQHYEMDQLQRAIEGAAWDAFEKDGRRFDSLELICRKVEDFMDRADAFEAKRAKGEAQRQQKFRKVADKILVESCGKDYPSDLPYRWDGSFDLFLRALENAGKKVRRTGPASAVAQCPAHADRDPSLSVGEGRQGRVLWHCHAGCSQDEVMQALDLSELHVGPRDHWRYGPAKDQLLFGQAG